MSKLRLAAFIAFAILAAPAFAADKPAAPLTDEQKAQAMDFAMHDAVFTLYHESGHLLIHELGLPVLGKEEDAADSLGVIEIFKTIKDKDELANTLNDVADGWYYSWQNASDDDVSDSVATYDDHSLDIQRANAIVCMMVGADPDEFEATAEDYEFDQDTIDGCPDTYNEALSSWDKELEPHLAKAPGPEIKITYEPAGKYQQFADELKNRKILESIAETLSTGFALPRPITMTAKQCDEANAFYAEEDHSITYCYELAKGVYDTGAASLLADDSASDEGDDSSSADQ